MIKKIKKFSFLIKPLIILFDLIIINSVVYYFSSKIEVFNIQFYIYLTSFWLLISYSTKFYNVHRYTHILRLLTQLISQLFVFILAFFAYFTIFEEGEIIGRQKEIVISLISFISFFKLIFFLLLKTYRSHGMNYRNVVIFGVSKSARNVASVFKKKQDLGYRFKGFFSDKTLDSKQYLGTIEKGLDYIESKNVDEVYCEGFSLSKSKMDKIREFCEINNVQLSLIPKNNAIYSKNFTLEYYGTIPILKPQKLPFEKFETHFLKRAFDLFFSIIVCVFILSWLLPFLWFFVKIDSKGEFFFKQKRDGARGNQFYCYKIRSMKKNKDSDIISTSLGDERITKVGSFLRKTSLDELPQFFNVFMGDMSVVGPRPHMNIETVKYLKEIDNYIVRNSVKPGITGLAQVSGYRGEVKNNSDIENRVRLDIFYIENWSFFLDLKIIVQTIFNIFKGQDKAY